ncbi:hypothetical protein Pmani_017207 [Petrolisthes manimaculis]|uniref:Uncharacterized protein n=1 Tax=Petrolisthes manimaculis TaxID=1843537 RepID=A0AAE1PNI3_9EUCA|nr:hypothetical protein Pmani_017207 [Petrolisthes manimaculis]
MGINQEDFVKAFVGALGEERVVKKLDDVICQRLVKEIQELRDVIKERDSRITDLEKEVTSLKEALDQQEQYTRRNNLRITGIKEKETEDVAEMSMDLINKNVCELEPITIDDVDRVHRVGRRRDDGVPRPILIRFSTYRARQRVYTNRRKLNLRQRQGIPGRPWAGMTESGASNNIYVNEDLTRPRASMLWRARRGKQENKIKDCWSSDGNVLVKDSKGTVRSVRNEDELSAIMSQSG